MAISVTDRHSAESRLKEWLVEEKLDKDGKVKISTTNEVRVYSEGEGEQLIYVDFFLTHPYGSFRVFVEDSLVVQMR